LGERDRHRQGGRSEERKGRRELRNEIRLETALHVLTNNRSQRTCRNIPKACALITLNNVCHGLAYQQQQQKQQNAEEFVN
jgi:hypothetical protein